MIYVKKPDEINKMRAAGKLTGDVLKFIEERIKPGITTAEINALIHEYITSHDAVPSFLGYHGYPASACVSVNDVVVHGIPGGYAVVREMVGHGIGRNMHEDPSVPNFGTPGTGVMLKSGYTLAVEPMINAGTFKIKFDPDGWTTRSGDGSLSAHYENTILVRDGDPEILTL